LDGTARYGAVSIVIDGGANIRSVDGTLYFRLTKLPQLLTMTGMNSIIGEWKDKWISFDLKATSSLPATLNNKTTVPTTFTSDEREKALQIFEKDFPLQLIIPKDGNVLINGADTYHYQFTVEKNKLRSLLTELITLYGDRGAGQDPAVIKESLDSATLIFASTTGDIYIGRKDSYLYRMTLHLPVDIATSSMQVSGAIDMILNASSFNAVAPIHAPSDATSIIDVYTGILEKAMGGNNVISRTADALDPNGTMAEVPQGQYLLPEAQLRSRDARRISNIGQIQLALELYFGAHQQYPKTLSPLTKEKFLEETLTDPLDHKAYMYVPLMNNMSYALGASLEYSENSVLSLDADQSVKTVSTSDLKGCNGEKDRYCYDLKP
jgi:hypothetical protein